MIKTVTPVTRYNGLDVNWMNVLIYSSGTDSFEGYQYIINRKPDGKGKTSVEKSIGGYNWKDSGNAKYSLKDNILQIAIPLSELGMTFNDCSFEFKVSDHVTRYDNIMDYYVTGDSAPIGRLNYSYGY